jgi:tetratricopeptide (TPR) repeat protein
MEGTRIGIYRVESELGSGAMGTVWRAEVVSESAVVPRGKTVAVKVVHPHLLAQPGFFKRFLREAEVGRQVDHENVVRTFDVDALEVEGRTAHFLVMEYVEGRTLRAMLGDLGTVPEALLWEIARQVAAGLSAIHEAGVVHRDLKPENVLVTDDHQVRIMDLGVARLVEESVALTRKGEFAGSLLYAAPEQFRDEEVGPLSDLYSLGVLLYELATGANPFRRDAAAQVISAHLDDMPRTATEVGAELSPFFSEVLTSLLAKRPEGRFDSAQALKEVLEEGERSSWWAERERELLTARGHLPKVPVRRETELYGRETELQVVREAWTRAHRGQGNTILLEGEAGIGKTRLVDTFLRELEGQEVHVLYGSYPPSGGMGGLSDAITDHFGMRGLEEALRPYLTVTPSLVPAFAALVKHESPPSGSEPIQGDALHAVMVHLMRGLAQEKPLVWVIDDLHFSEPDSRKIVLSLARAVEGHRVLLLTTTRPGLPEDEMTHFSRLENFRRVDLGRLSPREVVQLLRDAFKSEMLADKLGAKIAYKSDGVPFFVFEMIRGLREGQLIKELPDGTWVETQVIEEIEVPSAVKDLIEARLRDLTKEERAILDVASVLGFVFDADLASRVLGRGRIGVLQDLAQMERASGVVRAAADDFRFDHHQIQEVLYESLPPGLRRAYHSAVASTLQEIHPEPSGNVLVSMCNHFIEGGESDSALPYLEDAAVRLESALLPSKAVRMVRLVLEIDGLIGGGERVDLLATLARLLDVTGQFEDAHKALEEARDVAVSLADQARLARVLPALGGGLLWRFGKIEDSVAVLRQAQQAARLSGRKSLESEACRILARALADLGDVEEAELIGRQSVEAAIEAEDPIREATTRSSLGMLLFGQGRLKSALEELSQATGLLSAGASPFTVAPTKLYSARVYIHLGDADRARGLLCEVHDLYHEVGYPVSYVLCSLGKIAANEANWEEAARLQGDALEMRRRNRLTTGVAECMLCLGRVHLASEAPTSVRSAEAALKEALQIALDARHSGLVLGATVGLARLPDGNIDAALSAVSEHGRRARVTTVVEARFRLWDLTRDVAHLEEAHHLLCYMRDHAPEEYRESMITNVPLHRDIMAAWEEHGG